MEMLGKLKFHVTRATVVLVPVVLVVGMAGCVCYRPSQNLEIWTWYDLDAIRDNLTGNYVLMNDLDPAIPSYEELAGPTANHGQGWHPIGSGYWGPGVFRMRLYGQIFTGSFDGQGHEIRDMFINRRSWGGSGLFGCVGERGIIKNLGVTDATVTVPESVDGLVEPSQGTAHPLDVAPIYAVGVLAGFTMGTVSDSYASGIVSGDWNIGGLVGRNEGVVNRCYSTASVTGTSAVGGLVGQNAGTADNCYSTGNVTGSSVVGGLVGSNGVLSPNPYDGTVKNCYSTGGISGHEYAGGLVGKNEGSANAPGVNFRGSVRGSFWDMETSGQAASAGGTGTSSVEMKTIAVFSDAGWSIVAVADPGARNASSVWNIVDLQTYPFLSWQPLT